jgi:hypothetical protein
MRLGKPWAWRLWTRDEPGPGTWGGKVALLILCAASFTGCAPAGPRRPVAGTVTVQGQRLSVGTIQFFTDQGPAGGALIRHGTFRLPAEQGLEPGAYRVWISATEPLPELPTPGMSAPPTRELIPEEFNSRSTLTVEITKDGPNEFLFEIPKAAVKR